MAIKAKFIGMIIVIVGFLPFLTKIPPIGAAIENYKFLAAIIPGSIIYQAIIIILGGLLLLRLRPNVSVAASR
tara:strand:- start:599 stop:817 length:219 start_codon:yes stop_codon:yes gene_type:complete